MIFNRCSLCGFGGYGGRWLKFVTCICLTLRTPQPGATWVCAPGYARQPFFVEPMDPMLDAPCRVAKEPPNLRGSHSSSDGDEPVRTVVLLGLIDAANLVLEG